MKQCVQCQRFYNDETMYCLEDGGKLVPAAPLETETIVGKVQNSKQTIAIAPANNNAKASDNPAQASVAPPNRKSNAPLLALAACAALIVLVGAAGILAYTIIGFGAAKSNSNQASGKNAETPPTNLAGNNQSANDAQQAQAQLEKERQKLAAERRQLEAEKAAQKKAAANESNRLTETAIQQADEPRCWVTENDAGFANVRSEPNLNARVVSTAKAGAAFYPSEPKSDERGVTWVRVKKSSASQNYLGWISMVNLSCAG